MHLHRNLRGVVHTGNLITVFFVGLIIDGALAANLSVESSTMLAPVTAVERALAFPPDYMRREPIVHRANGTIFHIGTAVQFTDQKAFQKKAEITNYYHLQTSSDLTSSVADELRFERSSKKTDQVVINSSSNKPEKNRKFFLKRICR
jgi:hypothetical protein